MTKRKFVVEVAITIVSEERVTKKQLSKVVEAALSTNNLASLGLPPDVGARVRKIDAD